MKRTDENADKKTQVLEGLAAFLTRYRRVIVTVLILAAVGVVALVVVLSIQSNRSEQALESVEALQERYRDWSANVDSEGRESATSDFDEIAETAMQIVERYPGTYAALRAQMLTAEGYFQLDEWQQAAENFTAVASSAEGTYLAMTAAMAAGVSHENAGATEEALESYRLVAESEDLGYGFAPRALFAVGRIEETRGDIDVATEWYQRLVDDYPTSSWTNLARNRIITLTVEGRIGE